MIDGWSPGIGDPTLLGWGTTGAYALAAWLCARTAAAATACNGEETRSRRFWTILAVAMAALAINKQLDLQALLTAIGRRMAQDEGWYDVRRTVQRGFIVAVALVGGIVLVLTLLHLRRATHWARLAGVGLTLLVAFIVMRAASFHHMDMVVYSSWAGIYVNHVFEMSGVLAIALGAIGDRHRQCRFS